MYANSRLLPDLLPDLLPFNVYKATWPLLRLAARYSLDAYQKPIKAEGNTFVDEDWQMGTKAMLIGYVQTDEVNAVVLAIRGTQTFMDWAVNLKTDTVSPSGVLDDKDNFCHAGFLDVVRQMLTPVASKLKSLLSQISSPHRPSLVITGHSAGGAVASLLFSHMLSTSDSTASELSNLTGYFKRVHCVTFGAPPISLLPLSKPVGQEEELENYLFLSFINEGDPVTRAEKAYVFSLLDLYRRPAPKAASYGPAASNNKLVSTSKVNVSWSSCNNTTSKRPKLPHRPATAPAAINRPMTWRVPPATISNAGQLVLLRTPANGRNEDVEAYFTADNQLQGVVFGDPLMHQMELYCQRVELLATKANASRRRIT